MYRTALLSGASAIIASLAATGAAQAQTEVRWMHIETDPGYLEVWEDMVEEYNAANPDVNVTMQFLENEAFKARLPTLLQSDAAPHLFYSWGGGVLRAQAETGVLMNLTEEMMANDGEWSDSYIPASLNGVSFDDEIWAVPYRMGTVSFFYNKEIFEDVGINADELTDWESFLGAVEDIKEAGYVPIAGGGGDRWPIHFYWSYLAMRIGGQEVVDNAKTGEGEGFMHDAFVEAGQELARLGALEPFQPGYLAATWPQTLGLFGDGGAAMILGFENTEQNQRNNAADGEGLASDNLGRFPFPEVEGGVGQVTDTLGGLNGWAVTHNAPPETLDFLRHFTSVERQREMAQAEMIIPVAVGAEDGVEDPLLQESARQLSESTWHQNYFDQDFGPALGRVINDVSVEIVSGNMEPDQAVQMLADEAMLQ
ncbi:ABC transporter substrate-binding protein [Pelagibacterium montanilacus]|uniref:ABC transporter substrate-binding protein n=1 Tax=Pelagibacterium montanilacus TaxID=2185280 RepID=UPI000F8EA094|nr:extracellular solute-binding protein [Pelagibacterium montanilacus]